MDTLRSRAASIVPFHLLSILSRTDEEPEHNEHGDPEKALGPGYDESSVNTDGNPFRPFTQHTKEHGRINLLPPWARAEDLDLNPDEYKGEEVRSLDMPKLPLGAQVAQHNSTPSSKPSRKQPTGQRGTIWDKMREKETPTPSFFTWQRGPEIRAYMDSIRYGPDPDWETRRVSSEWLTRHGAYDELWQSTDEERAKMGELRRRKVWWRNFRTVLLRNPYVPLVLRLIVLAFSCVALGLGVQVFDARGRQTGPLGTSPLMAIIVDAIAIVYILGITWDEYLGAPLGLRSLKTKMRIVFLDLIFIVFESANLSLAFQVFTQPAEHCDVDPQGCYATTRQEGLAAVLLVALIAWLLTFATSVLRVMERFNR